MPTRKAIRYSMNSNATELEQVVDTHRTSCRNGWPRGFGELNVNPSPHSPPEYLLPSQQISLSPHSYLFTSATVRIPVHTTPTCDTEPIQYVTLHF